MSTARGIARWKGLHHLLATLALAAATWALAAPAAARVGVGAAPAGATASPALANLDLAQGDLGQAPPGWFVPKVLEEKGCAAVLVADHPESASRSVMLQIQPNGQPRSFCNLMRSFDAAPFRGQRVRFRAAVKVGDAGATGGDAETGRLPPRAQMWLRVDGPAGKVELLDNMDDRPIASVAWGRYEIAGEVPADAETIFIGIFLTGGGRAYFGAAGFEAIGKSVSADEPARPLDARGLDNLVAFARLAGIVRYFHPSDQAAAADWNRFVLAGVQRVEKASGSEDLARELTTLFLPLAPTVRVFPAGRPSPAPAELLAPSGVTKPRIVAWRHFGLGSGSDTGGGVYRSERVDNLTAPVDPDGAPLDLVLPEPGKPLLADLGGGVAALVPLALYAGDKGDKGGGTLPAVPAGVRPQQPDKPEGFSPSGNDRATRLADVVLAWNVFEHFYPYFDVVAADWPAELRRALRSAATDRDERAFRDTLKRLVAALHDGHGNVFARSDGPSPRLPLLWAWVEGQLVVTQVDREHGEGVERGDVVTAIDGRPAAQAIAAEEELISAATPQWKRYRALATLLGGPAASVRLSLRHPSGDVAAVTLARSLPASGPGALEERRPEKIAEVAPGVLYLDVGRVDDDDFKGALDRLAHARGIVFDFRGYPKGSPIFLQHLTGQTIHSAQWHVPVITRPDRKEIKFLSSAWTLEPLAPRLTAKIAFVTDGRAISYAESCLGIVENYRLGAIVGGPTAGTNGNVNPFTLPGGYRVTWTGMQVLKHDGSRHHGVGILPTLPAAATIKGIAEGRDEVLEKAIAVVSR